MNQGRGIKIMIVGGCGLGKAIATSVSAGIGETTCIDYPEINDGNLSACVNNIYSSVDHLNNDWYNDVVITNEELIEVRSGWNNPSKIGDPIKSKNIYKNNMIRNRLHRNKLRFNEIAN